MLGHSANAVVEKWHIIGVNRIGVFAAVRQALQGLAELGTVRGKPFSPLDEPLKQDAQIDINFSRALNARPNLLKQLA